MGLSAVACGERLEGGEGAGHSDLGKNAQVTPVGRVGRRSSPGARAAQEAGGLTDGGLQAAPRRCAGWFL